MGLGIVVGEGFPATRGELGLALGIRQQTLDRLTKRVGVLDWNQQTGAAVLDQVRWAGGSSRDNRSPLYPALENDIS